MIVLDASFVGALMLPDEPDAPLAVKERVARGPLIAPAHWPLESANMLHVAVRRRRIDRAGRDDALQQIDALGVSVDPGSGESLRRTVAFADRYGLTIYDAAYLDLAIDYRAALASRDTDLIRAAAAADLEIVTF
jgi:predicted nucleic acid-binding protein